jgi:hypothetical protein
MVITMRRRQRSLVAIALMVGALSMLGCGGTRGTVTGKVTMGGKPVPLVSVIFHGKDSKGNDIQRTTGTGLDGNYHITDVPPGEMTVTVLDQRSAMQVSAPSPKGIDINIKPPDPVSPVAIPKKYHAVTTSPLKYTVRAGSQDYPIDLTP